MIPDCDTNLVCFSDQLRARYPALVQQLLQLLEDSGITVQFIADTRDIWCRDYMPIQVAKDRFVKFRYHPDYLRGEYVATITPDEAILGAIPPGSHSVAENSPSGTVVGQLFASDPDLNESFTYELLDSAGGRFKLVGAQIQVNNGALLDYEQAAGHNITVRVRDSAGAAFEKTLTVAVTDVDEVAPRVAGVFVRGTAWSNTFLNALDSQGLGHPTIPRLGYAIPAGAAQLKTLPWTNINTITLVFSENVVLAKNNLVLVGVNVASYDLGGATFAYNPATFTATWTLPQALAGDRLLLSLAGMADTAGNALDGAWADGAGGFPSGNGVAGGAFAFRFNVLPGDVTQDGMVISNDLVKVQTALGTAPGSTAYSPWKDVTGDGMIISNDLVKVMNNLGKALPSGARCGGRPGDLYVPRRRGRSRHGHLRRGRPKVSHPADGVAEPWVGFPVAAASASAARAVPPLAKCRSTSRAS